MSNMLERARALTEAKRKAVANELLAWEAVELAIRTAASSGASKVTMAPAAPIKIKHAQASVEAVERLLKAGFRTQWTEHRTIATGPAGDQLEIEW